MKHRRCPGFGFGFVASIVFGLAGCKGAEDLFLPPHEEDPVEQEPDAAAPLPDTAARVPDTAPAIPDTAVDKAIPDTMPDIAPDRPVDAFVPRDVARDTRPPDTGPCGHRNEPCCAVPVNGDPASACTTAGTRCSVNKVCLTCGGTGQPCCRAVGATVSCQTGLDCAGDNPAKEDPGLCQPCGGSNQICCTGANQEPCKTNLGCNDPPGTAVPAKCTSCGALDTTCCDGGNCQTGGRCVGAVNGTGGTCKVCGVLNEQCCKGGVCTTGGTTCAFDAAGTVLCLRCGASGQPCCGEGSCNNGQMCKPAVAKNMSPTCP